MVYQYLCCWEFTNQQAPMQMLSYIKETLFSAHHASSHMLWNKDFKSILAFLNFYFI